MTSPTQESDVMADQPPTINPMEDAQAIFQRAQQAAERAETAAQRLEAAQSAASQEDASRYPGMPQEVQDTIAKRVAQEVMAELGKSYEVSPPTAPAATPEAGSNSAPASGGTAGESPISNPPAADPPPESFRNLAHRILGY
jgi:hypothetical protein